LWAFLTTENHSTSAVRTPSASLLQKAAALCQACGKCDLQWHMNRDNIWIVKPASMSRGRGIKTFNNLMEIFDYVIGKEISWVVQKYIENPLIIKKRKFDIRQWVLLTDFKPFRVWMYEEFYVRFCAT
jgi:tubulin monoglycylase TTLL3/8